MVVVLPVFFFPASNEAAAAATAFEVLPSIAGSVDPDVAVCSLVAVAMDEASPDPPPLHAARARDIARREG